MPSQHGQGAAWGDTAAQGTQRKASHTASGVASQNHRPPQTPQASLVVTVYEGAELETSRYPISAPFLGDPARSPSAIKPVW